MTETDPLTPLERELVEALRGLVAEYREWDAPRGGYAETHPAYIARAALAKAEQKEKGNG